MGTHADRLDVDEREHERLLPGGGGGGDDRSTRVSLAAVEDGRPFFERGASPSCEHGHAPCPPACRPRPARPPPPTGQPRRPAAPGLSQARPRAGPTSRARQAGARSPRALRAIWSVTRGGGRRGPRVGRQGAAVERAGAQRELRLNWLRSSSSARYDSRQTPASRSRLAISRPILLVGCSTPLTRASARGPCAPSSGGERGRTGVSRRAAGRRASRRPT